MDRKLEKSPGHEGADSGVELDGGEGIDADMIFINLCTRSNIQLAAK